MVKKTNGSGADSLIWGVGAPGNHDGSCFQNRKLGRRELPRELKRFAENPPWGYGWEWIRACAWEILPHLLALSSLQCKRVSICRESKLSSEKILAALKTTGLEGKTVLTKMTLMFPSVWLKFMQTSSWPLALDLRFLRAFTLENPQL